MARILLLLSHTTYRAQAFLEAARRLGVEATVGTDRRQVLSELNPAGNLTLAFSAPDRALAEILAFHRLHPLDAVLAADDDGAPLAARAAEALGFRHHPESAVATARHKRWTRERLAAAGLAQPRWIAARADEDPADAAARVRGFPCVVKPVDLSASRGVIRADDPLELVRAFARTAALLRGLARGPLAADPRLEMLIEDFVPGPEVALEGLVARGKLRTLALFDKPDPLDGPFFEETIYVTPSRLPGPVRAATEAAIARAVRAIGLADGPIHAEARLGGREPVVLEIAPRSIGGLCSRALRFGDGEPLEALLIRHAIGEDVAALERESAASGVMMLPIPRAGTFEGVSGADRALAVPGVEDLRITVPRGSELVPLPEGHRYLGFLFARAGTPDAVEAALREAHRRLTFEIAPSMGGATGVIR